VRAPNLLAISGSLRAASINSAVVRALPLISERAHVSVYEGLGDLPHFNPDLDGTRPPEPVTDLRARAHAAEGLILSVPEYAFGIPGTFKNALDWIVPRLVLAGKPVAVLKVSHPSRGLHVNEALKLVLTALAAEIVEHPALDIPVRSTQIAGGAVVDRAVLAALRSAVEVVVETIAALADRDGKQEELRCRADGSLAPSS
jgi:chromate reductase